MIGVEWTTGHMSSPSDAVTSMREPGGGYLPCCLSRRFISEQVFHVEQAVSDGGESRRVKTTAVRSDDSNRMYVSHSARHDDTTPVQRFRQLTDTSGHGLIRRL